MEHFATARIPNGYNGDIATVDFNFDPESGHTICTGKHDGMTLFFKYQTPPATDAREAIWLLEHHPLSNAKDIQAV